MAVISVAGVSERKVAPETVTLELTIEQQGQSRQACIDAVTAIHQAVGELLQQRKDSGVVTEFFVQSVRSGSYDKWVGGEHPNVLTQYARSAMTVTYRDFGALGIDMVKFGEERLITLASNSWNLTRETRKQLHHDLRHEAVADARQRAEIYAAASGLSLESVQQINEPDVEPPASNQKMVRAHAAFATLESAAMGVASDSSRGFDLMPPELEYSVTVHVHYNAAKLG